MKPIIVTALFIILLCTGCTQAIKTYTVDTSSVPRVSYNLYLYSEGDAGLMYRSALLTFIDAYIQVVPYSQQIETMIGTFEQAMIFMQRGIDYQSIVVEEVRYEGKTVGYLLTYRYPPYSAKQGRREVNLYEKDGTIYFSVERQLFVY